LQKFEKGGSDQQKQTTLAYFILSSLVSGLVKILLLPFVLDLVKYDLSFQISLKYEEMKRHDKNWKGKNEAEKVADWVTAALQVNPFSRLLEPCDRFC
jgi:hypothetical protein